MGAKGADAQANRPMSVVKRIGLSPKMIILAVVCLCLGAILALALTREVPAPARKSATASRTLEPTRPPLSPAEEEYIRALWPIHGEVERVTALTSLATIFYVNKDPDMSMEKFKRRVDTALATYQKAKDQIRALQPPASLQKKHDDYLAAIVLLEESGLEKLKLFKDGKIEHLHAAYPPLQQGTNKIRVIGYDYWPGEFVPH